MNADSTIWIRILQHCGGGYTSIRPLIDKGLSSSALHRWTRALLAKGWLETQGKNQYHTTPQGLLHLQAAQGETPNGLIRFYTPLAQVRALTILRLIFKKWIRGLFRKFFGES